MAFSAVFQFSPGDLPGRGRWLIEHYVEHMAFTDALLDLGVVTVNYPIQRMDSEQDWLAAHQKMTQAVWSGISSGGQTTDFETLDWSNDRQVQDWMNLHQLWHKAVRDALGL